jgi:hypothetical protein
LFAFFLFKSKDSGLWLRTEKPAHAEAIVFAQLQFACCCSVDTYDDPEDHDLGKLCITSTSWLVENGGSCLSP